MLPPHAPGFFQIYVFPISSFPFQPPPLSLLVLDKEKREMQFTLHCKILGLGSCDFCLFYLDFLHLNQLIALNLMRFLQPVMV